MPVPVPKACDIFVWLPSCLHFVVITAGCVCLIVYVFFNKQIYFAIIGLALVGLLWLFWIVTFLYRCVSSHIVIPNRGSGGGRIGDKEVGPVENVVARGDDASRESSDTTPSTTRRVRFGNAVVVEEQVQEQQEIMSHSSLSSSNIDDYHDISSPESRACERPFSTLTP